MVKDFPDFYRFKVAAAQRKLWANPDWRNAYYWAAFTLQGEWN
ncbi:MAG: hypothetical protein AAFS12_08770 [Cyanobacteria bacterium J06632_19]